jgi:ABC-type Fe3+-hydroxamate transport system substrate-binding protein
MPELIDHLGRKVNVPDEPKRIISFSPAITETLFELNLGGRIKGISAFCSRPEETSKIRKVGSYGSARLEVIREINPDLILTISGFQKDFAESLGKEFTVYTFELPSSVAGIIDLVSKIGIVTGQRDEARYMEFELMKYLGSLRRRPEVSGYLEIDLGGPVSFGSMSYITDALSILGVKSIYSDRSSEWVEPDLTFVKESNPDVIFYEPKMFSKFHRDDVKKLISSRGWDTMTAVKKNHVFVSPGPLDFFAHHGPSFIREVLPWAVNALETL